MNLKPFAVAACIVLGLAITARGYSQSGASTVSIAPADPNIQYIGRWDKSDPTLYHSYWGGAYLRTTFTGTSVGVELSAPTDLVVSIDDEAFRSVEAAQGTTALNLKPLKTGTHTLLVGSAGQNYEVAFQGLALDPGAATVASSTPPRPLIEFIGDSITTGTGPDGLGTVNWAWNSAAALGCDHTQIAFSGLSLTSSYGCLAQKVGLDDLYFDLKNYNHLGDAPPTPWNFSYTPNLVVINLGQNDQCGQEAAATFESSMVDFVHKIRSHFPIAQIAILRPFGGPYEASVKAAVSTLNSGGDSRVHYIDTTGWIEKRDTFDGIHPNGVGNLIIMGHLVPLLRPLI